MVFVIQSVNKLLFKNNFFLLEKMFKTSAKHAYLLTFTHTPMLQDIHKLHAVLFLAKASFLPISGYIQFLINNSH